jgi:hypothetical protein
MQRRRRAVERRLQYPSDNSASRRETVQRFGSPGVELVTQERLAKLLAASRARVNGVRRKLVERVEIRKINVEMAQLIATAVALSFGVGITMGTMFVAFAALFGA